MIDIQLLNHPYQYPQHDCYWLVREIRRQYGLTTPEFDHIYQQYPKEDLQPPDLALQCLEQCGRKRSTPPQHLDIACFKQSLKIDLGTVLVDENTNTLIVYMGSNGATIEPLYRRMYRVVESFWVL